MFKTKSVGIGIGEVGAGEMELINKFTLTELLPEEVFCFTLTLCDNLVDRDGERFDAATLSQLAEMFKGKPVIMNHSFRSEDQNSRIFDTCVKWGKEVPEGQDEKYCYLEARAYTIVTPENMPFIEKIRAGIIKEVSVGCSIKRRVCSICKKDDCMCEHLPGHKYGEKICHTVLMGAADAYEVSFVAVPAQPRAGVTKKYKYKELMDFAFSHADDGEDKDEIVTYSARELAEIIKTVKEEGDKRLRYYRRKAIEKMAAAAFAAVPELMETDFAAICEKLAPEEIDELEKAFSEAAGLLDPVTPQLVPKKAPENQKDYLI